MKTDEFLDLLKAAVDEFNAGSGDSSDGNRLAGCVSDLVDEYGKTGDHHVLKTDHEIFLQGPGIAVPHRLADAIICARNGHTTEVSFKDGAATVFIVPVERYRELCELEARNA